MYDELVEQLRGHASMIKLPHAQRMKLMLDAADAIEAISDYANTMRELRCEGWLLHKFHDGCQVVSTMQIPQPPGEE